MVIIDKEGTLEDISISEYVSEWCEETDIEYYPEEELGANKYTRERCKLDVYYPKHKKMFRRSFFSRRRLCGRSATRSAIEEVRKIFSSAAFSRACF